MIGKIRRFSKRISIDTQIGIYDAYIHRIILKDSDRRYNGEGRTMTYDLIIEEKDGMLWATVTGTRSLETVLAISNDILAACAEKKVSKVLIDVRGLEGRLSTMEAYQIPKQYFPKMRDRSVITHTALVDLKEFEHSYRFFENVALNRGFTLRIFSDPNEAAEWLKR